MGSNTFSSPFAARAHHPLASARQGGPRHHILHHPSQHSASPPHLPADLPHAPAPALLPSQHRAADLLQRQAFHCLLYHLCPLRLLVLCLWALKKAQQGPTCKKRCTFKLRKGMPHHLCPWHFLCYAYGFWETCSRELCTRHTLYMHELRKEVVGGQAKHQAVAMRAFIGADS
eukprot:1147675-Pelagomonas_calceolata.AAC.5